MMPCFVFQKSELNGKIGAFFSLKKGWILERFLELLEVFTDPMVHAGYSICVSFKACWPGYLVPIS